MVFLLGLVAFAAYYYHCLQVENSRPQVIPEMTGQLEQLWGSEPTLVLTFWHQHPGHLQQGLLTVTLDSAVTRGAPQQTHSFELWEPNQDHAVTLRFPLRKEALQQELPVTVQFAGRNLKPSTRRETWQGTAWKPAGR